MKKIILTLIGLGLFVQARSESLSTTDGVTYNDITAKRADPDGLYIEYIPNGGGIGMSKIKFSRLSPDQQKQFGYDATKARDFETGVAKAMDDWRQETLGQEQAAKAERQADQARSAQDEQITTDRIMAMAQLKEAEADLMRSENSGNAGGSYVDGGVGAFAIPEVANERHHRDRIPSINRVFPAVGTPFPPVVPHNSGSGHR